MLPAEGILKAAQRWLVLLQTSSAAQAWALIQADSRYTDLTSTQYADGLDWLKNAGLAVRGDAGWHLPSPLMKVTETDLCAALFKSSLEVHDPAWLLDADLLVTDARDLPQDAAALADALKISDRQVLVAIRQLQGHVDVEARARVGAAGELALIKYLEALWPGSTRHVAAESDRYGYDLELSLGESWHLEIKTTTRRTRLDVYLSRHEYEVGLVDSKWHLVVVGLAEDRVAALATVKRATRLTGAPTDSAAAVWEVARFRLAASDLLPGLAFIPEGDRLSPWSAAHPRWSWLPEHARATGVG